MKQNAHINDILKLFKITDNSTVPENRNTSASDLKLPESLFPFPYYWALYYQPEAMDMYQRQLVSNIDSHLGN